ncbi:hypothetical protein N7522_010137 [Penicillium canescens]|uniref:Uncharacterized protein n=1 Tax=Penicillium canescens TaxID=5083 RepID=A0AAD6IIA1_PENCN|nr:hypothetical protein N7522_010137 [Penicillium canescens]KAJ6050033.1 hypothetical protein N7444_006749 [Penicillium canescens]KAJ6051092.1 hypothetical protein N7460_001626 [Penicillium canescens]
MTLIIKTTILGLLTASAFARPVDVGNDILVERQGPPAAVGCPGDNMNECHDALASVCGIPCSSQGPGALGCQNTCLNNAWTQCAKCFPA